MKFNSLRELVLPCVFGFLNLELISISKEKLDTPMKNTYLTVTFNCCGKPTVLWMLVATGDEVSLAGHSSQYYVIVSV